MSERKRFNYLTIAQTQILHDWGVRLRVMFRGAVLYHVGSSTQRTGWRDVDVRLILPDKDHARLTKSVDVHLLNVAVSLWGERVTGLPIDFQVQQMTAANEEFGHSFRNPIGLGDAR